MNLYLYLIIFNYVWKIRFQRDPHGQPAISTPRQYPPPTPYHKKNVQPAELGKAYRCCEVWA